jgi:alpha-L-arabinofuranosidase
VNRHKDKTITADILSTTGEFTGKAEVKLITSESLKDPFTIDKQSQYVPVTSQIKTDKDKLTCSFPAHSFTQIKVEMKK